MCPGAASSRRYDAVRAGYTGDETLARALMTDPDRATRASALAALVRMKAVTAGDLTAGLADPEAFVRQRALRLLVGTDLPERWAPDLLAHLPDPDDGVTEVAAFVAGELYGAPSEPSDVADSVLQPARSEVVAALSRIATDHADALCRESAVAALGAIGHHDGLSAILAGSHDRATVRRRAVLALAAFEGPEVDAALDRLVTDRDLQVRQAAEDLR